MIRALLLCAALFACSEPPAAPPRASAPPVVATSFQPLYWMAKTLVGGDGEVYLMPPAEVDPARWMPDDAAIARARSADLIVVNGAGFETWTTMVSLPVSRLVDVSKGFRALLRPANGHHHGPGAAHAVDPHVWLDPQLARRQLARLTDRLQRRLPEVDLAARRARVEAALDRIEADLRTLGRASDGRPLLANHQAYDYLAARAGLQVYSLDIAPDAASTAAQPACAAARSKRARIMLWEEPPAAPLRDALSDCGLASIVLRPLERPPIEGDHERAHRADLAKLTAALRGAR